MPTTFARRQGWLKEPQVDEQAEELLPLDDRWKRWRDREEIRRLGFGAVVSRFPLSSEHSYRHSLDTDGGALPPLRSLTAPERRSGIWIARRCTSTQLTPLCLVTTLSG